LAAAAGIGEQGKNGLIICREFGPRFRSGCVTTDMPLLIDKPVELGVGEFCEKCKACLKACPAGAIPENRAVVRGVHKYTIDAYRCRDFVNKNFGCAVCIKVCVFNELAFQNKWLSG
jgi:epoxyqueuosine reductase QueG